MSVGEFWPERGVQSAVWTDAHRQNAPTGLSGSSVSVDYGEPYWVVDFSVQVPHRGELARQWSSFLRRRQGSKKTFTMNRPFQSFPYRGGVASDAALQVTSIDRATSQITLSGLEVAYQPHEGDMIGYFTAKSGFWVGEVLRVNSRIGFRAQLEVWPPPFQPHPENANPRRLKALGEFRILSAPRPDEAYNARGFRVTAEQVIRG